MSPALSVAASLSPDIRQNIGIQMLSRSQPISYLAVTHQVSRKFVYEQGDKAQQALDESLAPFQGDNEILFHLPVQILASIREEIRTRIVARIYRMRNNLLRLFIPKVKLISGWLHYKFPRRIGSHVK